jgi:cyclopropane fatty-acyl-phospholipid synthase-like methyltransferase
MSINMKSVAKPYAASCDENRDAILAVISPILADCRQLLEIGSGTGQHAVYFAQKMPHLRWHTSDCPSYLPGIELWLQEAGLENVASPVELDVTHSQWPEMTIDAVFTANTLHIMSDSAVENLFSGVSKLLETQGKLLIYGPFNYDGKYTSASNASFDRWLKDRDSHSGIKNFEQVISLAADNGLLLSSDIEMPANNRILYFIKS